MPSLAGRKVGRVSRARKWSFFKYSGIFRNFEEPIKAFWSVGNTKQTLEVSGKLDSGKMTT